MTSNSLDQTIAEFSHILGVLESRLILTPVFNELSVKQIIYLETIEKMGRPTFMDLVDYFKVAKSTVTLNVKRLEKKKLVYREQSQNDRRVFHICLTGEGEKINQMHKQIHLAMAQRLSQNLSQDEVSMLIRILKKIAV